MRSVFLAYDLFFLIKMLYNINYARKISSVACQARTLWAVHWQIIDNSRIERKCARTYLSKWQNFKEAKKNSHA